jgi:iron complex transport system substrate-binding protein
MLYTLAPDLLLGWPRANRADEREFLLPDVGARPEVGRITGRGNTANLEEVLALRPDLILDIGTINPTFVSLADRVQEQTGIPYALLDGRFDGVAQAYRVIGELVGRRDASDTLARYAEDTVKTISDRIAALPRERRARLPRTRATRARNRAWRFNQC